jgi:16S rRNA (guanine966-N2)-methyltransferase
MRIIGGQARGIRLEAGSQEAVRPTTDRIKETLFNILGDVKGCVVVDLFAGSGSLGLEALSRGAEKVYFVEQDPRTCRIIKQNLKNVEKSLGESGRAEIFTCSYTQAIHKIKHKPHLILADPPYADKCLLAGKLLENEKIAEWVDEDCILALEHTADFVYPDKNLWSRFKTKDFGLTTFTFWDLDTNA